MASRYVCRKCKRGMETPYVFIHPVDENWQEFECDNPEECKLWQEKATTESSK